MDERSRIQALLSQGRITQEEADTRMEALDELEATLKLTQGEHKLVVGSGDAEITFVDSSVTVGGVLGNGALDPGGHFQQKGRGFKGVVGRGAAKLSVQMGNGDLTLEDRSASA